MLFVKWLYYGINKELLEIAKENNNILTTENAEKLGFSRALLSTYAKNNLLARVRQGIYILPNSVHDELSF